MSEVPKGPKKSRTVQTGPSVVDGTFNPTFNPMGALIIFELLNYQVEPNLGFEQEKLENLSSKAALVPQEQALDIIGW